MNYDDPLPKEVQELDFSIFEKPTTRREWAEGIWNTISVIEMSTVNWSEDNVQFIQEAIRYFKHFKMLSLTWWTDRLVKQIISGEYIPHEKDSVRLTVNNLRGIIHDEWFRPEDININDEFSIRSNIRKEFVNSRDI